MEMAIVMARDAGMEWILHVDTDELIHPAGACEYSLRQLLLDVPSNVDMVIFPNYESSVERDDIKDPFGEKKMQKAQQLSVVESLIELEKEVKRVLDIYLLTLTLWPCCRRHVSLASNNYGSYRQSICRRSVSGDNSLSSRLHI